MPETPAVDPVVPPSGDAPPPTGLASVVRGWCRGCGYDLARVSAVRGKCPECGGGFTPSDRSTFRASPNEPSRAQRLFRRATAVAVAVLVVLAIWVNDLHPKVMPRNAGRLWAWQGYLFGVESARTMRGARVSRVWWAGGLRSVRVYSENRDGLGPDGPARIAWEARRSWFGGRWSLHINEPGVRWEFMISQLNEMKSPRMFGIIWRDVGLRENTEPFEAEGSVVDVYSRVIWEYNMTVDSFLLRDDQPHIWVFSDETRRLTKVPLHEALVGGLVTARPPSFSPDNRPLIQGE